MLAVHLHGRAAALVRAGVLDDPVDELTELARGRPDLVAQVVGLEVGHWLVDPTAHWEALGIAALLSRVELDWRALPGWIEEGRRRVAHGSHSSPHPHHAERHPAP